MNNPRLVSPDEAVPCLSRVLENGGGHARVEVRDDKCFKEDLWLRLGLITAHPSREEQQESDQPIEEALRFGSYSWNVPAFDSIVDECLSIFRNIKLQKLEAYRAKTRRALEGIVHCAVRCGFVHPTFDAGSVTDMPFIRPTTVVADTSAILQGALDFVARFLYPMARIKVPAIAHMEILNMADRYLTHRRCADDKRNPANALFDHVTSQAAQRVLLRLELQTETEIERPRLGADPLRGIVQPDSDSEDVSLGLQRIQRSFADRLILETAIHHRDRLSPDHPIVVLTADQGLARMTLAEGLHSLFFIAPDETYVCGNTLQATCFRPFPGDAYDEPLLYIPLATFIWELACTFGSARLITEDGRTWMTVSAIGETLSWRPFHSRDDLLWTSLAVSTAMEQTEIEEVTQVGEYSGEIAAPDEQTTVTAKNDIENRTSKVSVESTTLTGSYRFSVESMLKLVMAFERHERVADQDGMRIVGLSTAKRYADMRNFLLAGSFVEKSDNGLQKLSRLDEQIEALKALDLSKLNELFLFVPSFKAFLDELQVGSPIMSKDVSSIAQSAIPTYVALTEICCAALDIAGEGICKTPYSPTPPDFVRMAMSAYRGLRSGEDYILTGKWLEELARTHGVHPIRARERLNEARAAELIERYTEGSTPETQYERHSMVVLEREKGIPSIRTLKLYHGDFLIPGKASVSIRLDEVRQG